MKTYLISIFTILSLLIIHDYTQAQPTQQPETTKQTYKITQVNNQTKEVFANSSNPNDNLYLDQIFFNSSFKPGDKLEVTFDNVGDIVEVESK